MDDNTNNSRPFCLEYLEAEKIMLLPIAEHGVTDDGIDTRYFIVNKETRAPVGIIGMVQQHPEWKNTGLWIVIPEERNRREGYGLEALGLMEKYIFDRLSYQRIAVQVADCNQAAVHFFKKAGYKLEGVQELGYLCDGQYYDMILLRLLRKEYMDRQKLKTQ